MYLTTCPPGLQAPDSRPGFSPPPPWLPQGTLRHRHWPERLPLSSAGFCMRYEKPQTSAISQCKGPLEVI